MNPESWGFIGTLIGAIVGATASILTTMINSRNAIKIQQDIDENARKERFRNFQRENLLALQEKLSHSFRLVVKAHLEDLKNYKETQDWKSSRLSTELDNQIGNSFRDLSVKTERIDNDELRNEISQLSRKMSECIVVDSYEEGLEKLKDVTNEFKNVMPRLGEVLRKNY